MIDIEWTERANVNAIGLFEFLSSGSPKSTD